MTHFKRKHLDKELQDIKNYRAQFVPKHDLSLHSFKEPKPSSPRSVKIIIDDKDSDRSGFEDEFGSPVETFLVP